MNDTYGSTKVMSAIMLLIRHSLFHKETFGELPDHRYLMLCFEIPYELAEHVLYLAKAVQS